MELRQLEVFVAVATELHFGRAAQRLHMGQPTVSELVRRLEREVGTPLLTRTTRRVALTSAGVELLARGKAILDDVAAATAAVRRIAHGDAGVVRVGITPPVGLVLGPHLRQVVAARAPEIELVFSRKWLPDVCRAVADSEADVLITCGLVPDEAGAVGEVFCAERLLVALRNHHRLASQDVVQLADLAAETLGLPSDALFPAWGLALRQALAAAGSSPPVVELDRADLHGATWTTQSEVDWTLTTASVSAATAGTVVRSLAPELLIPYTLKWNPNRAHSAAVARVVDLALNADVPECWCTQPGHLRHGA